MEKYVFCNFFLVFLEHFPEFSDMSDRGKLRGSSFLDLHTRVLREEYFGETELYGFIDTLLETEYVLDDSSQGNLSDEEPSPEGFILLGGDDGSNGCEVDPGLGDGESSGDIDIHIIALQLRIAPLGEHRYEQVYLPARDSTRRALRIAKFGIGRERFYLDDDRAISLECDTECRTREMLIFLVHELESRVRDIDESCFGHTEESYLIGRTEAVLERSEYAIVLMLASLEKEYRIDQVFENLRSRDSPLFGNMSDEDDRTPGPFGEFHKDLGHVANLCDTPRLGRNIERRYHAHGIDDDEPRIVQSERFEDIFERTRSKEPDMLVGDTETIRSIGDLVDIFFGRDIDGSIVRITKPVSDLEC